MDEDLRAIREASRANLADIARRAKENDPREVRKIPDTDITLRVLGFIDGRPVLHGDDLKAWDAYLDSQYKCHWCCDAKRVYLHGEHLEPDVRRRGPGSACPNCCPNLTGADYFNECQRFPGVVDVGVDIRGLLVGAVTAYLNRVIAPNITKAQFTRIMGPVGSLIAVDRRALSLTFVPYSNVPDESSGRLVLVDDQGGSYLKCKRNERPEDKA